MTGMVEAKELRLAFAALAVFWLAAGVCLLFAWPIGAFIFAVIGTLALSERFLRITLHAPSGYVRFITVCVWLAIICAALTVGYFLLVPAAQQRGA